VSIPAHHTVVTGMTQLSGKTTTLSALIARSGMRAMVFKTKRGEAGLGSGKPHRPFFRERADWQYVQTLLESAMRERMKFERSWIIRACKGTSTLRGVLNNVEKALPKAKGLNESVYTNLKAYLELVIPEIERTGFVDTIQPLQKGLNVMDLTVLRDEVQALVIASTMEALFNTEKDIIIVIPEAWKFCPEGRGGPVKRIAETIIRQGAAIGIFLFFDSQDIAGVDKALLKQVDNWILGRQKEVNEVEHTLSQIPMPKHLKPKPEEIMRLPIGHFFACFGDVVRKVYVQPLWLGDEVARLVAMGKAEIPRGKEEDMNEDELRHAKEELRNTKLELSKALEKIGGLEQTLAKTNEQNFNLHRELRQMFDENKRLRAIDVENVAARMQEEEALAAPENQPEAQPADINTLAEKVVDILLRPDFQLTVRAPTIKVTTLRPRIMMDDSTIRGKIVLLVSEGFFDQPKAAKDIAAEAEARGWGGWKDGGNRVKMYEELKWLQSIALLRKVEKEWHLLKGARERIQTEERS
jgi:regulator of replication initiation timing